MVAIEFNKTKSTAEDHEIENLAGGEGYEPSTPEMRLTKLTINNLLEDTYYETDEESLEKVRAAFERVAGSSPEFPLKLAYYSREEMYLRDISQLLLVLSANDNRTKKFVQEYAPHIIQRADEPCTVVAMWDELFGGTMPKPLKKGINRSLHNFDQYQYAKYDNKNREVNIRDVINRTHPEPQDELRDEIFERLMKGDLDDYPGVEPLESPETWEVKVSKYAEEAREKAADDWSDEQVEEYVDKSKAQAYRELIENDKLPIFAKTRNIRNMKEVGLDSEEILTEDDLEYAKNSKMYPFRFYQAYRAVKDAGVSDPHIEDWLSEAIDATAENLPDSVTDTFVSVDLSGSMDSTLSNHSNMSYKEIGALFGALMMKNGAEASGFGDDFQLLDAHHKTPTLELQDKLMKMDKEVGNSTNGWKAIKHLREENKEYDRVVIFTDMQIWDSTGWGRSKAVKEEWDKYREEHPNASLYMIDLSSYGEMVTPEGYPEVYNLQGWNSNIIDYIENAENEQEMLNQIKKVEPGELSG